MHLSLQISPVGDTTAREVSAAAQDVHEALQRFAGVARVDPQRIAAPDHAKGGAVDAIGAFALSVAPAALKAAMHAMQTVLSQRPPTKILIQTKDGKISFEFDPRSVQLKDLVDAAERLSAAAHPS